MVMRVTFFATAGDGSGEKEVAIVTLDSQGRLSASGLPAYVELLFDAGQREMGREALERAMQLAPLRFTGSYLRAEFQEDKATP